MYVFMHACMIMHVIYACMYVSLYVCMHVYTCARTDAYLYIHACIHAHTHTYIYIYTHIHTYILYIHTQLFLPLIFLCMSFHSRYHDLSQVLASYIFLGAELVHVKLFGII